jgi:Domain of unknown function (DUF4382)
MKFNIRSLATFGMICLLTIFMGCSGGGGGGGGGGASGSGGTGSGSLALSLTDAPSGDYRAVYVTIDRVEVHLGGNEASPNNWQTIAEPHKTYNLLKLVNGVLEELGETELDPGIYTQMRLIIGETVPDDGALNIFGDPHQYANYIILKTGDDQIPLKVPSGPQTGIKLVKSFWVAANQRTHLILDFDAAKSVIRAGNSGQYLLKPTIKVIDAVKLYFIEGAVLDEEGTPLEGVSVSAQVNRTSVDPKDEVVVSATSSTDENGAFLLLFQQPGTYNIVAYKDTYGFAFDCGVPTVSNTASGVTTEFILPDLGSGVTDYGYVGGTLTVNSGGDVAISFRALECGKIEVKSITRNVAPQEVALYKEILPASEGPYYEVVASSEGKATEVVPGVAVESGVSTVLNFVF